MAADDGMLAPAPRRSACGERRRAKASGAMWAPEDPAATAGDWAKAGTAWSW